jgi:hypothetical protein
VSSTASNESTSSQRSMPSQNIILDSTGHDDDWGFFCDPVPLWEFPAS